MKSNEEMLIFSRSFSCHLPLLLQCKAVLSPFYFKVKVHVREILEPVVALTELEGTKGNALFR